MVWPINPSFADSNICTEIRCLRFFLIYNMLRQRLLQVPLYLSHKVRLSSLCCVLRRIPDPYLHQEKYVQTKKLLLLCIYYFNHFKPQIPTCQQLESDQEENKKHLTTKQANESRLVTKVIIYFKIFKLAFLFI